MKRYGVQSPAKQGGQVTHGRRKGANGPNVQKKPEPESFERVGADVNITGPARADTLNGDDLLRLRGLDPDDYVEVSLTVNVWQGMRSTEWDNEPLDLHQTKATFKRKLVVDFVLPDVRPITEWKKQKPARRRSPRAPELWPLIPDPHAPLHEKAACEGLSAYLSEHEDQIGRVFCLGDAADNSPWGRHRKIPRTDYSPTEACQSVHDLLAGWRSLSSGVPWDYIPGNHDQWQILRLREQYPMLENFCLPNEDVPVFNPRRSFALDALDIKYHDTPGGEYHDAIVWPLDDLTLMHGVATGKYGGAVTEVQGWEGSSVIQGHDHKLGLFIVVRRLPGGGRIAHKAISAGTLARGDLGYNHKHDSAPGFPVLQVWPDKKWSVVFAFFDPVTSETLCGDWRYAP